MSRKGDQDQGGQDPPHDEEATPVEESGSTPQDQDVSTEAPAEDKTATHNEDDAGQESGSGSGSEDPAEAIARLQERLTGMEQELNDAKQRWLRSRADYDNLVRRTTKEREDLQKTAAARLIGEILPQVEILRRAGRELAEVDPAHAKGIQMAVDALQAALQREGVQEVPGEGTPFDAQVHEAVTREPDPEPEGTITQVLRPGYTLHGRLLQAALVKVSAGPEDAGRPDPTGASGDTD
jgi:molecular chaperone GrpE